MTSKLDYPLVNAPFSDDPYSACDFQQKALSVLDRAQTL